MARSKIYIPQEVKDKIREHLEEKYPIALDGYHSANEDEDSLTGDLGATFRIKNQKVKIKNQEIDGTWTWAITYYKFRGRGNRATEKMIGADGIFELELKIGDRIDTKSVLFQSKKNWDRDSKLIEQTILMTTWREAAIVLNYEPDKYEVFGLDYVLSTEGKRDKNYNSKNISEFLGNDFLNCLVGDTDLSYDAKKRLLRWKSTSGIRVATKFSVSHRISIKVTAPIKNYKNDWYDKEIQNDEIHNFRMDAGEEEILSLPQNHTEQELKKSRNKAALLYHPDNYNSLDALQQELIKRRMQEINYAYEELKKKDDK